MPSRLPVIPHNNHVEDVPPEGLMRNAFGTPTGCLHACSVDKVKTYAVLPTAMLPDAICTCMQQQCTAAS